MPIETRLMARSGTVIELKCGKFKPEQQGRLGFYLMAVDRQRKSEHDNPNIGILLCQSKNSARVYGARKRNFIMPPVLPGDSLPANLRVHLPRIKLVKYRTPVTASLPGLNLN